MSARRLPWGGGATNIRAMRVSGLVALVLFLAAGCGARRAEPASSAQHATHDTTTPSDEPAPDPDAPCTSWDPNADPTTPPLDVAGPPPGANRGRDGLRFCILRPGSGQRRPTRDDRVRVHYTGWTTDGEMFDSSHGRGEPASFPVSGVIRGWTYSLEAMTVGQMRRVWIPEELAYQGRAGAPAGMLVFDIELLGIE